MLGLLLSGRWLSFRVGGVAGLLGCGLPTSSGRGGAGRGDGLKGLAEDMGRFGKFGEGGF